MNEEIKNKLNTMSIDLIDQIQKGAEWTGEQTSLFVKEYIAVYIIQYSVYFVFWLVFSIVCGIFSKKLWNAAQNQTEKSHSYGYSPSKNNFIITSGICFALSLFCLIINIHTNGINLAKGIWAPRVVIVEELQKFIK